MPKTPRREIKNSGIILKNCDYERWKNFADKQGITVAKMIKKSVNSKINSIEGDIIK